MGAYKEFAGVYDILMHDIDYEAWYKYLRKIWKNYSLNPRLVLDLGCGTGNLSVLLARDGYDVIGLDSSPEMLAVASEKARKSGADILFLNQRMENFELYGTVDCIISFFDCINYIVNKDGLANVFALAQNYLNPGGLFIFDINTKYKYKNILAGNTFAENSPECSYIWENSFNSKTKINEYALSLFISKGGGIYEKKSELHCQRAYGAKALAGLIGKAGLDIKGVFDAYTFKPPHKRSERIFFVCEKSKEE